MCIAGVRCGHYGFGSDYTLDHMGLPAALQKHIHEFHYPAGHMLYLKPQVGHNISAFIKNASAG